MNANLDELTYDEKRLALDALGVEVAIYRPGTRDDEGKPLPRWAMTLNPLSMGASIVYP